MAFKYRRAAAASVKEDAAQSGGNFANVFVDGIKEFRPEKGRTYTIRILPPTWGDDDNPPKSYAHEMWVNFGIGPDDEGFISRSKHGHDDDPVVEMHDRMRQYGDEYAEELKDQRAKKRRPMYVLVRGEEDQGAQAWACPWTVQKDIAKESVSKKRGTVKYIDDPDEGYDVIFSRASTKFGDYEIDELDDEPSPILPNPKKQAELLDWLVANPLPDQYRIYSYDEINRRCLGDMNPDGTRPEPEEESEDVPEDRPRTRSSARRNANSKPKHEAAEADDELPAWAGGGDDDEEPPELVDDESASLDGDEETPQLPPAPKKRKAAGVRRRARAEG